MIQAFLFSLLLNSNPYIVFYGITIPISSDQITWSKSGKNIDFLEEMYIDQSRKIIHTIDSAGSFNDWQKVQLSIRFAKSLFPGDTEKFTALSFYLWNEMGFDVQPGYNKKGELIPLIASEQSMFGLPFFKINGIRYYDLLMISKASEVEKKGLTIHSDDPPPKWTKKLVIDVSAVPFTGDQVQEKILSWSFENHYYSFTIPVNIFLRTYFHDLPNVEYKYLLDYKFSENITNNFINPLREEFKKQKLSDDQIAECLRQMILQCFPYIDDQALFGYEHVQFPEELLLSEGCDCEDRSLFLYKLLEQLTELTPLMADYPTHVSVLINSSENWQGDSFEYKGKKFIFCDPTFFNAPLGAVPEAIKDLTPDIIERISK